MSSTDCRDLQEPRHTGPQNEGSARALQCPGSGFGRCVRVSSSGRLCKGCVPTAATAHPSWHFSCGTWKPRLRGECECTDMCQVICTSLCSAALAFAFACLFVNSFRFCPKRNVLAQVPSVHGSFRSACCLSSTPAALLCAAWELGLPRPVLNPRSAKQATAL